MNRRALSRYGSSAVIAIADDVLSTQFDDEVVLLSLRDGVYYGLEGVGARIWALIQKASSVGDIQAALAAEYDVDATQCHNDLAELLTELNRRHLISVRER